MEGELFNPYWSQKPPDCCYCPPVGGIPPALVNVSVVTTIDGGFGQLSFMTRTEDAFRIIEQSRLMEYPGAQTDTGPWATPDQTSGGIKVQV